MVPRKKKYESGEAANFMTRKRALKKLQLTLKVRSTYISLLNQLFRQNLKYLLMLLIKVFIHSHHYQIKRGQQSARIHCNDGGGCISNPNCLIDLKGTFAYLC